MKKNAIKILTAVNPCALQDLHIVSGFDFCAPFGVYYIAGRYTVKQVEKLVNGDGYTAENAIIAICTRDKSREKYGWSCDFQLATVQNGEKVEIDYRQPYHYGARGLDTFRTKGSFEEVRKSENAETVIFAQAASLIKKPIKMPVDLSDRFKLLNFDWYYMPDMKKRYINRLHLQKIGASGEKFDHEIIGRVFFRGKEYAESVDQVIDKSGYLLQARRDSLKRRAAALRAEREKAAFAATDNAAKIEELQKLIDKRKQELVKALEMATTAAEVKAVYNALSNYNGFSGIVSDFERLKDKDESKSYSSVDAFTRAYDNIHNALTVEGRA